MGIWISLYAIYVSRSYKTVLTSDKKTLKNSKKRGLETEKFSMEQLRQLYGAVPTYENLYKTEPVVTGSGYHCERQIHR